MKQQFEWVDRIEYPFRSRTMRLNGATMHYVDEGNGQPILFVHGTPSWTFDFRKLIEHFSKKYRCVAADHVGFGLSSKPRDYNYSIAQHVQNLEILIASLNLRNIIMVVHDFGGPIGFEYALKHPENIDRFVVLNSWLWDFSYEPAYQKFEKIGKSPLLKFLYLDFNFSPRILLPASFGPRKPPKKTLQQYRKPFPKKSDRYGCLAFAKSLMYDQRHFQRLWEQKEVIAAKPLLFVWGMNDRFVTPAFLRKFQAGFSRSTTTELANCGHFPQEEQPRETMMAIEKFLEGAR